jgi:hypothetical protein
MDVRRSPALERAAERGPGDPCGARHEAADAPVTIAPSAPQGSRATLRRPPNHPRALSLSDSPISPGGPPGTATQEG